MKKFIRDFGTFIKKGNVLNLAVGFIIGGAFQRIVSSLVNDILMPIIGAGIKTSLKDANAVLLPAKIDPSGTVLRDAVILRYGAFIQAILDFLIIAFSIFMIVKTADYLQNASKRFRNIHKEDSEIKPTELEVLTDIRNLLAKSEKIENTEK